MEIFVIPAKMPPDVSSIDWTPDPCTYFRYTGFRIECKDHTDMFAVDVFPRVQVSMMKRYHQHGKEPILSLHGIKVMGDVEGMVQLTTDRTAIHVAVREIIDAHQDAATQLLEMKEIVLVEIEQHSSGTAIEVSYLSPKALSSSQDLVVHYFSEQEVEQADVENRTLCSPNLNQETTYSIMGCLADAGDYQSEYFPRIIYRVFQKKNPKLIRSS